MNSHDQAPNGVFCDDMILFGSPERGAIAAQGYWIEPPDLRGASVARLNAFQDQIRALLALIIHGRRLQIQWSCDADYRAELLRYHGETQSIEEPVIRRTRNERFTRYWDRMTTRQLRREHLAVFLSIEITTYAGNLRTPGGLREHYAGLIAELRAEFDQFAASLRTIFHGEAVVRLMTDNDHCRFVRDFLNPSLCDHDALEITCDPKLTLQEQCWICDGIGQPDGGFHLDGRFHAILALARWPQRTRPGIVTHLTGLPFLDYRITVNITPGATRAEVQREERAIERLSGEYAHQHRQSLLVALRKKERKVENLAGGFVRPFFVSYLLRIWAPTRESLREKIAAVQAAVHAMDGAQYIECSLPTTAKKLFFASWPGWTHSSYRHRELYAEDNFLADLLPFSATYTGALAHAEAIYDGSHDNLVGVSTFTGGSPQHAVLLGMTGAGKSMVMHDLLLQTAARFRYTMIIEEGLSYKAFTEALGETPIVVHPDSPLTLNYLDTQGLPLTQLHLASVVTLLSRMVGEPANIEQLAVRQAQLSHYVDLLYRSAYDSWAARSPAEAAKAVRLASAVHRWRQRMPAGTTPLDAFADLRDRRTAGEQEAEDFVTALTDDQVAQFASDSQAGRLLVQTACAAFHPADFPTHSSLVDLLAQQRAAEHPKEEIDRLVTLLRAWTRHGPHGRLFDGATNVSLNRKVAHFELGLVPEQAVELKAAIGLLISGFARQHILALPRSDRKRIIFEEVARFLDVPGGEQIVAESYAQLRKFNCWAVSIVQQYARFKASRIRPAVIGNAKQFFFMRQADRGDLVDLGTDLGLPETAIDAIQRYPMPEQLGPDRRYSSLCHFTPTTQPPQCGTLRHIAAPSETNHASPFHTAA